MRSESGVEQVGRPVRIVSIGFANGKSIVEIAAAVEQEAAVEDPVGSGKGADLIALPETWLGQRGHEPEPLDGPSISIMAPLACRYRTYIVCPIDRLDGDLRRNSAVLLDRAGRIACVYDKVYPFWSEFDVSPPVTPARDAPVHEADFGKVGMAICFDVNFPEVWQSLAGQGAELVIWPSAYSAGSTLRAHALMHHFYIVTATQKADCIVCDITGQEIYYQRSDGINVSRLTVDLDRCIFHYDFNLEKRDRLLAEHGEDVEVEQDMSREAWFVLRAKRPGVSARELAHAYGMEELRDYIQRSRQDIDRLRSDSQRAA